MSLYRRRNTPNWWCRFQVNKREVRLSTGTGVRSQAEEFEAAARARAWRQEKLGEHPPYRWEDAKKRWLAEQRRHDDPSVTTILNWLDKHLKGKSIQEITRGAIEKLRELKLAEASEATVDRHMERRCRFESRLVSVKTATPKH